MQLSFEDTAHASIWWMGCKEAVKIKQNGKDIKKLPFYGQPMMPIDSVDVSGLPRATKKTLYFRWKKDSFSSAGLTLALQTTQYSS